MKITTSNLFFQMIKKKESEKVSMLKCTCTITDEEGIKQADQGSIVSRVMKKEVLNPLLPVSFRNKKS